MNIYQLFLSVIKQYTDICCPFCSKHLKVNFHGAYEGSQIASLTCVMCSNAYKLFFSVEYDTYLNIRETFCLLQSNNLFTVVNLNSINHTTGQETPFKLRIISSSLKETIDRDSPGIFLTHPEQAQKIVSLVNLLV